MSDPSTESWRRSLEMSTGARLRYALEANRDLAVLTDRLSAELAQMKAENEGLHAELQSTRDAEARNVVRLTSALAREREESDDLARDLEIAIEHNAALSRQLVEARAATADVETHRKVAAERLTRAEGERDEALAENDRLRAQLAVRPGGNYHLTAKGLAATEPTQPETGEDQ